MQIRVVWPYVAAFLSGMGAGAIVQIVLDRRRNAWAVLDMAKIDRDALRRIGGN